MPELIFLGLLALFVIWVVFVFLTKRGREILFGGKIVKSWDGVSGKRKIVTSRVKVHAVDAAPSVRFVGLEISNATFGGYEMVPIALPAAEAIELARLIEQAAKYQAANET